MAASIGVAMLSEAGPQVTDLLAAADAALYQAKRSGGNQIATTEHTPSQRAALSD